MDTRKFLKQNPLLKLLAVIIVIVGVFAAFIAPLAGSIRQGLDLQGGTHVVLEGVDTEQAQVNDDAMNRVVKIMEKRVNELGLTEPIIQREGERRIIIELPGVKDPDKAIAVLGKTAMLEFKDEEGNTVLSGTDLKDAREQTTQNNQNEVAIEFTDEGAQKFADLTSANVGRTIAILLDGEVISAPVIQGAIMGGSGVITGNFTIESASDLAMLLRSGALPAPLEVLEERTVGPGLGADSIKSGSIACMVGVALVVVAMIVFYGLFGVMANVALVVNLMLVIGLLALLGGTLTLPGIAGIVLTMGMAVDANVLIFERIREETKLGRSPFAAIESGFNNAMSTIVDANLTTLIASLVLFQFGTGPVRGFAVTLGFGILTTMFSAIILTRMMVSLWALKTKPKALPI